ncbi:hypothetical protein K1719_002850 [Acacia pycnantha]|nr:hypothetical protein K1719_002850 [Acacia pycnantha]
MDMSWIKLSRNSLAYLTGLTTFLDFAFSHASCNEEYTFCGNQLDQDDPVEAVRDAFGFQDNNFAAEVQGVEPIFFRNDAAQKNFSLMNEADHPLYQDILTTFYKAKNIINRLSLNYKIIDARPNECMLYWGDDARKETYKKCHTLRFRTVWKGKKQKKKPAKILRYFLLKPRLQRFLRRLR